MKKFNDLSIRVRLFIAFGIICIFFVIAGTIINNLNFKILSKVESVTEEVMPHSRNFKQIKLDIIQIQQWLTDISATRAAEGYDDGYVEAEKFYMDAIKRIDYAIVEHEKYGEPELVKMLHGMKKDLGDYYKVGKEMAQAYIDHGPEQGNIMMEKFDPYAAKLSDEISSLVKEHVDEMETSFVTIKEYIKHASNILIAVIATVIILSLFIAFIVATPIINSLKTIVEFAKNISNGDLTKNLDIDQKDEVGMLAASLGNMSKNLRKMFSDISSSTKILNDSSTELSNVSEGINKNSESVAHRSGSVAAAAEEMSTNMNSVAASTEETSANINMIVAASEEMTSTINEISQNMAKGNEITSKAVLGAEDVSLKVNELGTVSLEISKVTETIADISAQTNLLALNATIEAARAGEAGKGFAVVAQEIKSLAQQTEEATKDISDKITGVQTTTSESVEAIESIVAIINEINEIVTTVAAAIEEQSATTQEISINVAQAGVGVQEVNENINQISTVTSEVTEDITEVSRVADEMKNGSQQVNESSTELSELAESLNEIVGKFKI
jgi:methyl-accepting chemotaxis protein